MEKNLEKSLIDALSYCDLRDLPKKDDKEFVWLKSLALVSKSDGTKSYALAIKDKNGNPKIVKDFGTVSAIRQVIEYYPFCMLDASFMPMFKTRAKDERIAWLEQMGEEGNFGEISAKELDKKVLNVAIQQALKALNDN